MRFTYNQDDIRKKKQRVRKGMREHERRKKESQKKEKERERDKERDTEKESEIVIYYETEWGKGREGKEAKGVSKEEIDSKEE